MQLDDNDEETVQYLPATIVKGIKRSREAGVTHLMHFDDGDFEKVGLPPALDGSDGMTFDIWQSLL